MEGRLSVGLMFGVMLSVPLWLSMIGWMRLVESAVGYLSRLHVL
ncbi:hypothetical protein P9314_22575 [Paenibacillus validus]|nr:MULTISPECIES: hypothetical protein [Paenibacillus]MED4603416.1 hypothetical protein [Paenibacillus validus]MED4605932.1 hypothetical protein [Paenibacillus validus]